MTAMLEVDRIDSFYGPSQILFAASLAVGEGEVVTLMGRNGMGKTTLIKSILGLVPPRRGRISFRGYRVDQWQIHRIAQLGIGLAPEGRQVFPLLNVRENLLATSNKSRGSSSAWTLESVFELFPRLKERARQPATTLSGGEQQMLSIGRALMTNPMLLILDEATEGLAPLIREEIWKCIRRLKEAGLAILVVDRNLEELMRIADRHFILEKGGVVWSGDSGQLRGQPELAASYLRV